MASSSEDNREGFSTSNFSKCVFYQNVLCLKTKYTELVDNITPEDYNILYFVWQWHGFKICVMITFSTWILCYPLSRDTNYRGKEWWSVNGYLPYTEILLTAGAIITIIVAFSTAASSIATIALDYLYIVLSYRFWHTQSSKRLKPFQSAFI